jgi:large subunit ribosomal protein L23
VKPAHQILIRPVISEKAFAAAEASRYVFIVAPEATKPEVRGTVERAFGVKVTDVHTISMKGRSRRYGRIQGKMKPMRKSSGPATSQTHHPR